MMWVSSSERSDDADVLQQATHTHRSRTSRTRIGEWGRCCIGFAQVNAALMAGIAFLALFPLPTSAECVGSDEATRQRYVVKGAKIHDTRNNLTWMRCSLGQRWDDAGHCQGAARRIAHMQAHQEEFNTWRLPTLTEIKTLVAGHCKDPVIDGILFPDTPSGWYHTSSKKGSYCWYLNFADGRASHEHGVFGGSYGLGHGYGYGYKDCGGDGYLRLVRSGR